MGIEVRSFFGQAEGDSWVVGLDQEVAEHISSPNYIASDTLQKDFAGSFVLVPRSQMDDRGLDEPTTIIT